MKVCRTCHVENEDSAIHCRICNGIFFEQVNQQAPSSQGSANNSIICVNCGREISSIIFTCPHCGHHVDDSRRQMHVKKRLRLITEEGHEVICEDGDILDRMLVGKEVFKDDRYVSRSHIKIQAAGNQFIFQDISGGNSFFLNGQPVPVGGQQAVQTNDNVMIGLTKLRAKISKKIF